MRKTIYTFAIILCVLACKNKTAPKPEQLEGYWKIKSFTVDPPLADSFTDLTGGLDSCSLGVTFYFRSDGTTTFLDVPEPCKGDLKGINLNTDAISRWRFEDNLLIIYNDYSPAKDRFELIRPDNATMVWKRKKIIALPADLGGIQEFSLNLTFRRVTAL